MFGDLLVAIKERREYLNAFKRRVKQMFCFHDYEYKSMFVGLQSITRKRCKKCNREKYYK